MYARWHEGFRTAAGVIVLALVGAGALHVARAAEWAEPTGTPPTMSPPGFVWTRAPSDPAQVGGQFHVAGSGKIGGVLDVVGKVTVGELCFGAECKKSWAEVGGTGSGGTGGAGGGTTGGCFGSVLRGKSLASTGDVGGYVAANGKCASGQHVCTTTEVLNSINCGAFASAGVADGTDMWIANLAPSLPTPTNDCIGWTTGSSDWRGIKWRLNTATGGAAYAERCSTSLPFACCS